MLNQFLLVQFLPRAYEFLAYSEYRLGNAEEATRYAQLLQNGGPIAIS